MVHLIFHSPLMSYPAARAQKTPAKCEPSFYQWGIGLRMLRSVAPNQSNKLLTYGKYKKRYIWLLKNNGLPAGNISCQELELIFCYSLYGHAKNSCFKYEKKEFFSSHRQEKFNTSSAMRYITSIHWLLKESTNRDRCPGVLWLVIYNVLPVLWFTVIKCNRW